MPEPVLAAEGEQGEQTATAQPQSAVDKPETTTQSEGQSLSDANAVMDLLDIPPELQDQIAPKAISKEPETDVPETETKTEEETPEVEGKKKKEEAKPEEESDEDDAEGEEDEEKEEEKPAEQKIDKRQKRINRLTRARSRLEGQVDEISAERDELKAKLESFEKKTAAPVATIPQVGPWMPDQETADTYSDLSQKKIAAEARVKWCNAHSDGVNIVENGQQKFMEPDEIASLRSEANMVLMEVNPEIKVIEREAKQAFKQHKVTFDNAAYEFWPDLADKKTPDYQEAQSIMKEFPTIAATPAGLYYVGLAIEGKRSLEAKLAAKKNGKNGTKPRRDIDPKVFTTPRVPIAPHTAEPPTRESVPSSSKKITEATNSFMADQDGSAESLARVFQARDEAAEVRPRHNSPVKV